MAAYSEIIIAALHPGVTDSQVQADFAVGNVSKILTQDFDVYNWAPLGWSGGSGPDSPTYAGGFVDFNLMVPGGLVNVEADVPADNTTMISYFLNKQIYYLAINGTCSVPATPPASDGLPVYAVPSGITEMGIWGTQSGANSVDVFPVGGAGLNPECESDLSDPGYYAVVGQYGVNAGPDFQAVDQRFAGRHGELARRRVGLRAAARRRQPRRQGGHQQPDDRAGPLRPDRHDLVAG